MAEIQLADEEDRALRELALTTGRTPEDLIREAVQELVKKRRAQVWKEHLRAGEGMWANRTDLPSLEDFRGEWASRSQ